MRVRVVKEFEGSQTGADVTLFLAGWSGDMADSLAEVAISEGWAVPAETKTPVVSDDPQGDNDNRRKAKR